MYRVLFTKQAQKDAKKIAASGMRAKVEDLISVIAENPFRNPPPYEKLVGDLSGAFSRRINIQHRLIYQIYDNEKAIKVMRMWKHDE